MAKFLGLLELAVCAALGITLLALLVGLWGWLAALALGWTTIY